MAWNTHRSPQRPQTNAQTPPDGPNTDLKVGSSPGDSVSQLKFSPPQQNGSMFLMASSWDNGVYIYEVDRSGNNKGVTKYEHAKPVLCCEWMGGGTSVVSGDAEGNVALKDMNSGAMSQMGKHDAGVSGIAFLPECNMVMTSSYDKTVRYWDGRQPQAAAKVQLSDRAFCMDACSSHAVVAGADKNVAIFNLSDPTRIFQQRDTNLQYQLRCVSCFAGKRGGKGMGFAAGSIEGRVAIVYLNKPPTTPYGQQAADQDQFTFRCHRSEKEEGSGWNKSKIADVYPVNSIAFNDMEGTFATCGGDGMVIFWDHENKQRIHKFSYTDRKPVTTAAFSKEFVLSCFNLHFHRVERPPPQMTMILNFAERWSKAIAAVLTVNTMN